MPLTLPSVLLRKQTWLDLAELIDAYRVFPRLILSGYGYMVWDMWEWVKSIHDLTTQQGIYVGTITGLAVPLSGWYFQTGRKWGDADNAASG